MNNHWENIYGWFTWRNIYDREVDKAINGARFVEVGTFLGKSTCYLGAKIVESQKNITLFAIDTFVGTPGDGTDTVGNFYKRFMENLKLAECEQVINVITDFSIEAAKKFENNSIDFCWIDANHAYEAIKMDIEVWLPKMKKGAVIGGHDYTVAPEVRKAVNEKFGNCVEINFESWIVNL